MPHVPVLLEKVIEYLDPKPEKFIIDGTMDGGGHSAEILKRILPGGKLLGIDWDVEMIERAKARITRHEPRVTSNLVLVHGNYADIPEILNERKLPKADGILLDLGFSSEQLENSGRGFSFEKNEPLLMTYDDRRAPVSELLRGMDEKELAKIIYEFGGERFSRRIAKAIVLRERKEMIRTTGELCEIIRRSVPGNYEMRRLNPATRTFQALRIYANDELGNLEKFLSRFPEMLADGGRAVIISFHSLEDRLVKNYFRKFEKEKKIKILTKKPVTASEEEIKENPRSRSAKLRAIVRC